MARPHNSGEPVPWGFINNSVSWGFQEREILPLMLITAGVLLIGFDAIRGQMRWYLAVWLVLLALAYGNGLGPARSTTWSYPTGSGRSYSVGPVLPSRLSRSSLVHEVDRDQAYPPILEGFRTPWTSRLWRPPE